MFCFELFVGDFESWSEVTSAKTTSKMKSNEQYHTGPFTPLNPLQYSINTLLGSESPSCTLSIYSILGPTSNVYTIVGMSNLSTFDRMNCVFDFRLLLTAEKYSERRKNIPMKKD